MQPRPQVWNIVRVIAGLCVAAGLIYFLYSDKSPPIVSVLIVIAVVFFLRVKRKSGVFAQSPTFRRLAMVSSSKPLRDFGLAVACLVATLVVTLGIVAGVDHNVLPDNKADVGNSPGGDLCGNRGGTIFYVRCYRTSHLWAAA
jgi:hypothetical protein